MNETKWIPVEERLPEYGKEVLTYHSHGDFYVNHLIDDENAEWFWDSVIAWMPLPEPYEPKEVLNNQWTKQKH